MRDGFLIFFANESILVQDRIRSLVRLLRLNFYPVVNPGGAPCHPSPL